MARRSSRDPFRGPATSGPRPGTGDSLDREIDASLKRAGPPPVRRRPRMGINPATGVPIGQEEDGPPQAAPSPEAAAGAAVVEEVDENARTADELAAEAHALAALGQDAVPVMPVAGQTPAERLRNMRRIAPKYAEEYEAQLLKRMLMRQLPLDAIASQLGCSIRTVHYKRGKLFKRMEEDAARFNMNEHIAWVCGHYKEVAGKMLQFMDDKNLKAHTRIQAAGQVQAAMNDMVRFLAVAGVYQAKPFTPVNEKQGMVAGRDMVMDFERLMLGHDVEDIGTGMLAVIDHATGKDRDDVDEIEIRI